MASYSAAQSVADEASMSLADTTGRGLGAVQISVLSGLLRAGRWPEAWIYDTHARTAKVLDSLVKRGLVEDHSMRNTSVPTKEFDRLDYRPTAALLKRLQWHESKS
jgi:hypothetical protein